MNVRDDIICDLLQEVRAQLGDNVLTKDAAEKIESDMRYRWGGQEIYIQGRAGDLRARNVRAEYNGCNRLELQAKYSLSRAQFYKIIKGG